MRTRRIPWLVVALALCLAPPALAAQSQAPAGSVGIRLLDAPTNRADDPRARVYIVDHLAPGTTIKRRVEISNGTDGMVTIPVYAAAANVRNGEFRFGDGRAANELTTWTHVDPSSVVVQPNGTAVATVTIDVPSDASAGERYGVVWAELPAATPTGGGISTVNRVGVRVYLSIGPGGEPASNFTIKSIRSRRSESGAPIVAAVVENTGGRALDLTGELTLNQGPAGLSAGPFPASLGATLGIGATEPVVVTLDKALPAGPWKVRLSLKAGLIERHASVRLTFPTRGAGPTSRSKTGPALFVALVAAALLATGFAAIRSRRRSREDPVSVA